MTVYLVRKQKNRVYRSEKIVYAVSGKELSHDEKGAPCIEGGFVSISDTKGWWACAFSDRPVGIDMEELSRSVSPSAVRKLHKSEREYLSALSEGSSEWKEEFLSIWTKKESYAKYKGEGLAIGFSSFSVLEDKGTNLDTALYGKKYKGLVFGSTEEFGIEEFEYEAPMNKSALEAGADILDMFGCSAEVLRKKLLGRGYAEDEVDEAVAKLTDIGFLNDSAYTESLAIRYAQRGYSSRRMVYELGKKGIDRDTAQAASEEYRDGDRERAKETAIKMAGGRAADDKLKAKIARKLSSLGYDTSLVYDIIHGLK